MFVDVAYVIRRGIPLFTVRDAEGVLELAVELVADGLELDVVASAELDQFVRVERVLQPGSGPADLINC